MMHLQELFAARTRKRSIDRLEAENLKAIELKLKGMDRSAVDEKLKNIRDELAEGKIPRDFQLAVWC